MTELKATLQVTALQASLRNTASTEWSTLARWRAGRCLSHKACHKYNMRVETRETAYWSSEILQSKVRNVRGRSREVMVENGS
eukprot:2614350-Pleurochrysis_carterae.AAC.2